ncbi:MAG TPA: glycosyltransferase family 4 protein [Daejeonella sp.]|nr:glycosyltransferase family 4 protein [Daejeonella sp.]
MELSTRNTTVYKNENSFVKRLKVFTWPVPGCYLYFLSQGDFDLYIPVNNGLKGYYGRGEMLPYGSNIFEVPAREVKNMHFDCILYQSSKDYLTDRYEILSDQQRNLPQIYLEHNPPTAHLANTRHVVDDPEVMLVHVNHFNKLMWDNNNTPNCVIEPGVIGTNVSYTGAKKRGLVVIDNLSRQGRLAGLDVFLEVRKHVPLDLVGRGTQDLGLGEIPHSQLAEFSSRYRFFFCPARYLSLNLCLIEAMLAGIPVVGLATTGLSTVIRNGTNGFIHNNLDYLIAKMKGLLEDHKLAFRLGKEGQRTAQEKFNIQRFTADWKKLFEQVVSRKKYSMDALKSS